MYCEKPCDGYKSLRERTQDVVADAVSSSDFRKHEKRLANYCKVECPRPESRRKNLSQKL